MKGININCSERDFCALILSGAKPYETRRTPSLRPYVGRRVGIVRTGRGPAVLVGYATITGEEHLSEAARDEYAGWLLHTSGTSYGQNRYAYRLADVRACEPRRVTSRGIVAREI